MTKPIILLLLFATFSISVIDARPTSQPYRKLQKDQDKGVEYYKQNKFELAYKKLKPLAEIGMKKSQYFLGFLYLKGQFVEQSTITGLAWIGVANETHIKDWQDSYDTIFSLLPETQQQAVVLKKALFIEQYGMLEQRVDCKLIRSPSKTKNKKVLLCQKWSLDYLNNFEY